MKYKHFTYSGSCVIMSTAINLCSFFFAVLTLNDIELASHDSECSALYDTLETGQA